MRKDDDPRLSLSLERLRASGELDFTNEGRFKPVFAPPTLDQEEKYIARMIERDKSTERY
jgi:hypothetical protein